MPSRTAAPLIVWVIQGDETYGVRQAVVSLTDAVRAGGWRVVFATLDDGPFADECARRGFEVRHVGAGAAPSLSGGLLGKVVAVARVRRFRKSAAGKLLAATRDLRPDAYHVLWAHLIGIAGAAAARLGVPCFWEMVNVLSRRIPFGLNQRIYQRQCRRFGIVPLANSRYTASTLGDRLVKPLVMHLGVDSARFDPDRVRPVTRAELGIGDEAIVFAVVGRLDASKGQDRVLEAILDQDASGPPLHLLLIGAGDEAFRYKLAETARQRGAADRLHLLGPLPDPEGYYGAVDVAVNFLLDAEGFGLSVVEAMMMGRPVLVHASGGPAETVVDGETGWHVADNSVASLAAGVRRALADRQHWAEMGAAARRRALEYFSVARQADFYRGVVERTLAGASG